MKKRLLFISAFVLICFSGYSQAKKSDVSSKTLKDTQNKEVISNTPITSKKTTPAIYKNSTIPTEGLVGLYYLDDNNYDDSSDSGYNFDVFGAGGTILPSPNRFDIPDKAIYLLNEYMHIASNPSAFNFDSDSNFSICTWIKIEETIIDWTAFINNWNGFGTGGYYLGLTPEQQIRWNVNGDFPVDSDPVQTGVWIHVAVTYDGVDANLWIDGQLVGSETNNIPIVASPLPFTVGTQADLPNIIFPGRIDDRLVYERVLTNEEIEEIFSTLSVEDLELFSSSIKIYPNPTNSSIQISYDNSINNLKSYQINDIKGRVVLQNEYDNLSNSINLNNLNAGVYFIKLNTKDDLTIIKKIIKK